MRDEIDEKQLNKKQFIEQKDIENDDFWTLDEMLPPKTNRSVFSRDTEAVLIESERPSENAAQLNKETIPKRQENPNYKTGEKYKAQPLNEYSPENSLITHVSVWLWPSRYTFYERFRSDAEKHFTKRHEECCFVPFFSYMPQYAQLNYKQLNYYLWWRENLRNKTYIETDYSYIQLYIYEIINLPEFIVPVDGANLLCDVWLAYRKQYDKLDQSLSEWLCDYCLIYNLAPPLERLEPIIDIVMKNASFREFYLRYEKDVTDSYAVFLMNFASNYNYNDSKFITEENRLFFAHHIVQAFNYTIKKISQTDRRFQAGEKNLASVKLTRDAFAGSLCAYNIKRRIDIEYLSYTRSTEIRRIVTDIIKLAENNIRYLIGVKSRLSTPYLKDETKIIVNEYFKPYRSEHKPKPQEPEYEKMYESDSPGLSVENALELEEKSWGIIETLEGAFSEQSNDLTQNIKTTLHDDISEKDNSENKPIDDICESPECLINGTYSQRDIVFKALSMLLCSDNINFNAFAEKINILPDALAEIINEYMYNLLGDIAVEPSDSGYKIIDDYRDEIERMEGIIDG